MNTIKKPKIKKHKQVIKALVKSPKTKTKKIDILKKHGYTYDLKKTKTFNESLDELLPDEYLLKKHGELIQATRPDGSTDFRALKDGLEMAYKLKGKYSPTKLEITAKKFEDMNDNELLKKMDELKRLRDVV